MYSSALEYWYKKRDKEAERDKLNKELFNQLQYEPSLNLIKDVPIFDWRDLNNKTLKLYVTEDRMGLSVIGLDENTGMRYVIKCEPYERDE